MKLFSKKFGLPLALLCIAGIGQGQAHADWKGYAGLNCKAASSASSIRYSTIAGVIYNSGKSPASVICPIVRDVQEGGVDKLKLVRLRLRDRNSTVNGSCKVQSRTVNGTLHDSVSQTWTGTGFRNVSIPNVDAPNWGYYTLTCQLPGRDSSTNLPSYIIRYAVDEND